MTQTPPRRSAGALPERAAPITPVPTPEAFKAECEALTAAVAAKLEAILRPNTKTPPRIAAVTETVVPRSDVSKASAEKLEVILRPDTKAVSRKAAIAETAVVSKARPIDASQIQHAEEIGFVPPYRFIVEHVEADQKGDDDTDDVTVSRQLLEFLLRCALGQMDFDEQQYQACNPDVAAAIKQGKMQSGREHFIKVGYFEGRTGGVHVDEAWYLARNPDVAAAKKAGKFVSGEAQYRLSGANEWRSPNPQSEDAIRLWRGILEA